MNKKFGENMRKLVNKLVGYGIWILIVLLVFSVIHGVTNAARVQAEITAEQDKVVKMQKDNADLQSRILATQSEDYIEKEIRDELGLVKTGEVIVVLPDESTLRALAPPTPQDQEALPDPNWKKWEKLFL